eukprot:6246440-Amphidinium_carterae.1
MRSALATSNTISTYNQYQVAAQSERLARQDRQHRFHHSIQQVEELLELQLLPMSRQRTNIYDELRKPRGVLLGLYATR